MKRLAVVVWIVLAACGSGPRTSAPASLPPFELATLQRCERALHPTGNPGWGVIGADLSFDALATCRAGASTLTGVALEATTSLNAELNVAHTQAFAGQFHQAEHEVLARVVSAYRSFVLQQK